MTERLLTASELGERLGFAAGTVVDWAEAGKLPAFKIGGRLRFRESEVLEWLEAQRVGPDASSVFGLSKDLRPISDRGSSRPAGVA
jgi:excisionase family DNA binding protein